MLFAFLKLKKKGGIGKGGGGGGGGGGGNNTLGFEQMHLFSLNFFLIFLS